MGSIETRCPHCKNNTMTAKEKLIQIVENAKGDKLERFEFLFSGLTEEQLKEEYGPSCLTKEEILTECRNERREWEQALALAKRA
jgi:hypothetical protein